MVRDPLPPAPRIEWAPPPNRWRQLRRAAAILVVLALVGGGIGWLTYIHHYQPVGAGSSAGPLTLDTVARVTNGLDAASYVVLGPAGTKATLSYAIRNNGHFDIKVLGSDQDSDIRYQWAPSSIPVPSGGGRASNLSDARDLPATLPAHEEIQLFVTVTKQSCSPHSSSIVQSLPIRWQALGVHHTTWLDLDPRELLAPIATCYPRSALRHLERF